MNSTIKIALFWSLIGICFALHGYYELSAIRFGIDVKVANATGKIPANLHAMRIVLEIGSLLMGVLTLQWFSRGFRLVSFIWAILLGLLNTLHLVMEIRHDFANYTQVALLSFILFVNVLLILELNNLRKKDPKTSH